jgi:hypothetical protein
MSVAKQQIWRPMSQMGQSRRFERATATTTSPLDTGRFSVSQRTVETGQ